MTEERTPRRRIGSDPAPCARAPSRRPPGVGVCRVGVLSALLALGACGGEEGGAPARGTELSPHPADGEGRVRVLPGDPVIASSWGSWTVEWIAGPSGLPVGGGVVLQVSPFWGWSRPQVRRPDFPGFTTARSSTPGVVLDTAEGQVPMTVVARVRSGRLAPGDTLRFVYGDSASGGSASLSRTDMYAEEFEELLIKTDGNGDGFFVAVPDQPTLRILAGSPVELGVAAPALAGPGESFRVGVHGLDPRGNRAELPSGRVVLLLRPLAGEGRPVSRSADTLAAFSVADAPAGVEEEVRIAGEGLYRIRAVLEREEGTLAGENDLLLVEEDSPFAGILWGDIHCHSALSDGTGAPSDLYAYARDVSGLDVAVVTDHDAHGLFPLARPGGWDVIRAAARDAYRPGRFVTLLAYEWTSWTWGHRNVYYPTLEGEVFAFSSPASDSPEELWERIAPFGGMTIPHHPGGGPMAMDWSVPSDEERERVVEICSIHGSSEAPGVERGIYRPVAGASVRDALRLGHRLGILASGDTHDGHPGRRTLGAPVNGLVAFRAGEATREAVWGAMRERRVYGTSGPRILLATDWGGAAPGAELTRGPKGPLTVRVVAPAPVEVVEVVGPEGTLASSYGGGRRVTRRFFEEGPPAQARWLYVRVLLADGEVAWESPFWLPRRET